MHATMKKELRENINRFVNCRIHFFRAGHGFNPSTSDCQWQLPASAPRYGWLIISHCLVSGAATASPQTGHLFDTSQRAAM